MRLVAALQMEDDSQDNDDMIDTDDTIEDDDTIDDGNAVDIIMDDACDVKEEGNDTIVD